MGAPGMEGYLPCVGFDAGEAARLGDQVRERGRLTLQPAGGPPVRLLEVASDLAVLARETGGPAWPAVTTRWRTDFALERLTGLPGGHLLGAGLWEPVPGQSLRAALHVNTLSDLGRPQSGPRVCSAYLSLLVAEVSPRGEGAARLAPSSGPTAAPLDQCRVTVRARVTDTYTVPNDLSGKSVRILWLSAPGAWAIQVAAAPGAVAEGCGPGAWVEAVGVLQGDLVVPNR